MCAPVPVLGSTASAQSQEQYGRPQALDDLGTELRQDLLDSINWKWLQACFAIIPLLHLLPTSCLALACKTSRAATHKATILTPITSSGALCER